MAILPSHIHYLSKPMSEWSFMGLSISLSLTMTYGATLIDQMSENFNLEQKIQFSLTKFCLNMSLKHVFLETANFHQFTVWFYQ